MGNVTALEGIMRQGMRKRGRIGKEKERENGQHDSESGSVCRYINANVSSL